jgi:hypothetical protein
VCMCLEQVGEGLRRRGGEGVGYVCVCWCRKAPGGRGRGRREGEEASVLMRDGQHFSMSKCVCVYVRVSLHRHVQPRLFDE